MRMRAALLSHTLNTNSVCVDSTDKTALVALYVLHQQHTQRSIDSHTIPYHTIAFYIIPTTLTSSQLHHMCHKIPQTDSANNAEDR